MDCLDPLHCSEFLGIRGVCYDSKDSRGKRPTAEQEKGNPVVWSSFIRNQLYMEEGCSIIVTNVMAPPPEKKRHFRLLFSQHRLAFRCLEDAMWLPTVSSGVSVPCREHACFAESHL